MKNPALTANLESPSFPAKTVMELLVHRARTTMRQKAKTSSGRKKRVTPGFKQAYQSWHVEARLAREAEEASKREREENEVSEEHT